MDMSKLSATAYGIAVFLSHPAVLCGTCQKRAGDSQQIPETNDNHQKNCACSHASTA